MVDCLDGGDGVSGYGTLQPKNVDTALGSSWFDRGYESIDPLVSLWQISILSPRGRDFPISSRPR